MQLPPLLLENANHARHVARVAAVKQIMSQAATHRAAFCGYAACLVALTQAAAVKLQPQRSGSSSSSGSDSSSSGSDSVCCLTKISRIRRLVRIVLHAAHTFPRSSTPCRRITLGSKHSHTHTLISAQPSVAICRTCNMAHSVVASRMTYAFQMNLK